MRDLKRPNAKLPAYKMLEEKKIEVFVPKRWKLTVRQGRRVREEAPFMHDLLFVHASRLCLDPIVMRTPTLQYRWLRHAHSEPMTVSTPEMDRFMHAVGNSDSARYYLPEEITPQMYGRRVRIIGGPLDGYEGCLLTTRGSRVRRLLVGLSNFLAAGVEVNPEYIQFT